MDMKIVAFNGSARKDGNTAQLIRSVLQVLEAEGIETELTMTVISSSSLKYA